MMEDNTFGRWYNFDELYAMASDESCGEKILDAVVKTLREQPSIYSEEVAASLGANRRDLSGAVRILTGKTLDAFIKEWRLRQAMELVRDTDLSFEEIAAQCGYAQAKTMTVAMEKRFHVSPYEYRNGHHRNGIRRWRWQQEILKQRLAEAQSHNPDQE